MSPELKRLAKNLTRRRVVIETIAAAEQAFSFADLCDMVKNRDPAVSRTTVYRTLRLLRDRQLVRLTVLQGGNRVFHLGQPTIFSICDDCSRICTFFSEEVIKSLRLFAETKGFHSVEITVEVHSPCEDLRRKGICSQDSSGAKEENTRSMPSDSACGQSKRRELRRQLTLSGSKGPGRKSTKGTAD